MNIYEYKLIINYFSKLNSNHSILAQKGERIWRTEDILKSIEEEGDSVAVILLSGSKCHARLAMTWFGDLNTQNTHQVFTT